MGIRFFSPVVVKYLNYYEFVDIGKSAANGINYAICVLYCCHNTDPRLKVEYMCVCVCAECSRYE